MGFLLAFSAGDSPKMRKYSYVEILCMAFFTAVYQLLRPAIARGNPMFQVIEQVVSHISRIETNLLSLQNLKGTLPQNIFILKSCHISHIDSSDIGGLK